MVNNVFALQLNIIWNTYFYLLALCQHILSDRKSIVRYSVSNIRTIRALSLSRYIVSVQIVREDDMSSRYLCCLCDGFFYCAILTKIKKVLKKPTKIGVLKVTPWGMFSLVNLDNRMTVRKWYHAKTSKERAWRRCGEIPGQELFRVKRQKPVYIFFDYFYYSCVITIKVTAVATCTIIHWFCSFLKSVWLLPFIC